MDQPEKTAEAEAAPPKRSRKGLIVMAFLGLVSAAAGFAVPQLLGGSSHKASSHESHDAHDAAPAKSEHASVGLSYVPFGEVVANLDDNRMMRYVRAKFSLSVAEKDAKTIEHTIEENKTVLKNWLIGYLQNKQIEEVRGTDGFNRIRREILDRFNEMLYPGGEGKLKEVLFEEFNVQ